MIVTKKINKKMYAIIFSVILMIVVMSVRFKIAQPFTPIFGYNDSIFSVSNEIYEVSSEKDIQRSVEIRKTIDKSSLKYLYKFKPKRDLESYMVASFSEIYLLNDKSLKGNYLSMLMM